jgi:hypothetical protein
MGRTYRREMVTAANRANRNPGTAQWAITVAVAALGDCPHAGCTASISGESVSGTVYVDRQGRVRRLVTITPEGRVTVDRNLTFDDFGVQAAVTAPPASQAEYTSYPYWGFYF